MSGDQIAVGNNIRLPVTSASGLPAASPTRTQQLAYRKSSLRSDVRALTAISFCIGKTERPNRAQRRPASRAPRPFPGRHPPWRCRRGRRRRSDGRRRQHRRAIGGRPRRDLPLGTSYWQVKGRLDLKVTDLGATPLKNIGEPIRVYSLKVGQPAEARPPRQRLPRSCHRVALRHREQQIGPRAGLRSPQGYEQAFT